MDPISTVGTVIAIFQLSSDVIKYIIEASGATRERRRLREEIFACESILLQLQDHSDDAGASTEWYDKLDILVGPGKPLHHLRITLDAIRVKLEPKKGWDKALSTLRWPFDEKEVGRLISSIQRERELLQLALTKDSRRLIREIKRTSEGNQVALLELVQAIKDKSTADIAQFSRIDSGIVELHESQGHVRADVRELCQYNIGLKQQTILDWISPIDYAAQQIDFINRRQPGTGQWFVDSIEFQKWANTREQTLFCPGIPGAGKTIITSIAVEHLHKRFRGDSTVGIAYLYCNFRRQGEQRPEDLLGSLLKQLAQGRPSLPDSVRCLYTGQKEEWARPSINELSRTLQSVAAMYSRVFVVIDALDECQASNGRVSKFLSEVFLLQMKHAVNVFATSRFIPVIMEKFKDSLSLEIRASQQDIRNYVDGNMSYLPSFVSRNPVLQEEVKTAILNTVDGMFLLARLHLDSLVGKRAPKALRAALTRLPTGSDAYDLAYTDVMARIEGQVPDHVELAKQVLSWISWAKRPLTVGELQYALAVEVGEPKFDPDNLPQIEDIVSVCAGLVTVDEASGIIRLTHYTIQNYFERIQESCFPHVDTDILEVCITCMSYDTSDSGFCSTDNAFEERLRSNMLYDYAAQNWGYHARAAYHQTQQLILDFLQNESNVFGSSQALMAAKNYRYHNYSQEVPKQMTGVHLAAYFGLGDTIVALLDNQLEADPKDSYGRTPLSYAAERGHDTVVKLLLAEASVHPDQGDSVDRWTPLWYAVATRRLEVIKLLLGEEAVDPDSKSKYRQTPLSYAAERGDAEVVKLLLETSKVDPNFENAGSRRSPLSIAAANGHEAAVRILIENSKVNLNAKDHEYGRTALSWAAERGHKEVVELLLANEGVDRHSKSKHGRTPQWFAKERGHKEVFKLFVSNGGLDLDLEYNHHAHMLLWQAAERGQEVVVKRLLTNGVNPNSRSEYGRTPLSYAAEKGYLGIVQILLENQRLDPDVKDSEYERTPLSWAAANGHTAVVETLLHEKRVNPDSKSKYGRTPLSWAARFGHERVVKLLLTRDTVDPNSKSTYGRTALSYAAERGYKAVAELLLQKDDIDYTSQDSEYGRTPLLWAVVNGHDTIVELLLSRASKTNVNVNTGGRMTKFRGSIAMQLSSKAFLNSAPLTEAC